MGTMGTMDALATQLTGTCAFRLLPSDDLADAPSRASLSRLGAGLSLTYTWEHPVDGEQFGGLVVGGPGEEGRVQAAWYDTWHQQPDVMTLIGRRDVDRVELEATYAEEWGWTITIDFSATEAAMTMCNVVPESALASLPADAPPVDAGPYDVMVARWFSGPTES